MTLAENAHFTGLKEIEMTLAENASLTGLKEITELHGFDSQTLKDLLTNYGIRCEVLRDSIFVEDKVEAEKVLKLLVLKLIPMYRQRQLLKKVGRSLSWCVGRLMCFFGHHEWTCDAEQGIKPTPEQSKDLATFLKYAKMYCRYCKVESEQSKRNREAWKERVK